MIEFKYPLNTALMNEISSTVDNYNKDYLKGILEEGSVQQLKFMGIFLLCEEEEVNNSMVYRNPLAVVAKSQQDACRVYYDYTGKDSSVMCDLEPFANKVKVYPLDED